MAASKLPDLPAPHAELVAHLAANPGTPITQLLEPYRVFEQELRGLYAQQPDHVALRDPHVNVLPLFTASTPDIKVRARALDKESQDEKDRYIMSLPDEHRRADGSPAVVESLKRFQENFNIFSESALVDMNWDNVVVSGSAVTSCLLPVPKQFARSKRALREFYHEKFCPASDVDLFLYGLTEEQALAKIADIEASIKDSILTECTTVRTKHAITICSSYPTRHVQIVLRIYTSISEILTGFDVDCSGAAYDGKQVYCTPRALQSFVTQINQIDLSRRSPSYENRLSKYSHRGFEVYWPGLDRSRIDPTIFERSFRRTLGLARLLVLERLPTSTAREQYLNKRRAERGRPALNRGHWAVGLRGNIKESHEDEVAEWVNEDEVSNYHTFTIPYGPRFTAKKIEKLCYTRDLLLNAEWNQPKEREVYLHRHPAFFGRFVDVAQDCCGFCPKAVTEEELAVAEVEDKTYVSGKISFIKDDPGRQEIGSFNPLTDDDWTEMAYVGNTARLCQAIVDGDAEHVQDWLAQEGADPNKRDHTGRAPLHLAAMTSTPEVVRLLVDKGARLVARLADGRTALHLAAERGSVDIVKILMDKSNENEAEAEEKKDRQRSAQATGIKAKAGETKLDESQDEDEEDGSDGELVDDDDLSDEDDEGRSMATGSFVKIERQDSKAAAQDVIPDDEGDDFYDVNVVAWDTPCSALHLAIISGHIDVVKLLCEEYGADVLLPVKILGNDSKPVAALLTLVLSLSLPVDQAKSMTKTLLALGATSAQADMKHMTAFYRYVDKGASELVETLLELDPVGAQTAINHLAWPDFWKAIGPLQAAVQSGDSRLALKLLDAGAIPEIDFETWLKSAKQAIENRLHTAESNNNTFRSAVDQPLMLAVESADPTSAIALLERGADPNALTKMSFNVMNGGYYRNHYTGETALDVVRRHLALVRQYEGEKPSRAAPQPLVGAEAALEGLIPGTWKHWVVTQSVADAQKEAESLAGAYAADLKRIEKKKGQLEKKEAIAKVARALEKVETAILERGGKTFDELHPEVNGNVRILNKTGFDQKQTPFEFKHSFYGVKDVTPAREAAYVELFEAAWSGNLERIKELTLASWDEEQREPPLMVSVKDSRRNNLFAIAVLRGHREVAKAILEIAQAQYAPDEAKTTRFTMNRPDDDSDCSSGDESVGEDDDKPQIFAHIVDDKFTVDNIGEISMQVKSRTRPLQMLLTGAEVIAADPKHSHKCITLFGHAIMENDLGLLRFLLDVAMSLPVEKDENEDEPTRFFNFPREDFDRAISSGHTEILAEIIKRTGAGLPLEEMVKQSGRKMELKPRYYQGLSVYGKKRKDWAAAGRGVVRKSTGTTTSPLLLAAFGACIESVEWFLSDAPLRNYLEFCGTKTAREDARLKHLSATAGGFEKAITTWLQDQNELVLHAAALTNQKYESLKPLVEYLIKTFPAATTTRSVDGYTPLHIACRVGRPDLAELLMPHSDQTAKDHDWNNILHLSLAGSPLAAQLQPMLELMNAGVRKQLFKERNKLSAGGRTPLCAWLDRTISSLPGQSLGSYQRPGEVADVMKLLLEYSGGEELDMLDGAGNTVLHMLIARGAHPDLIKVILDQNVKLLHRENAVGRTPAEAARDAFVASRVGLYYRREGRTLSDMVHAEPDSFVDAKGEPVTMPDWARASRRNETKERQAEIYNVCQAYLVDHSPSVGTRRLASLGEANDVAQRLGATYQTQRYYSSKSKADDAEDEASEDGRSGGNAAREAASDFVSQHTGSFSCAWKWSA
ncbi:ankyrin repeat protein [Magnaporthiopsis poae ATCC 64411]|uniref:Ankyrin repeat protein n=1 Tax=Magnaporthiopsis poae (strain ATCC 64411 / 73-15) TaxID=644358 RepID=A0A0C4E2E7_MAGP6|nr:ankyrin repeat protein [Magnaporthiopsis poae ATCC 64411]